MTRARAIAAAAVWIVLVLLLWVSDSRPAIVALGGVVAAIAAVIYAGWDVGAAVARVEWSRTDRPRPTPPTDDPRIGVLRHQIQAAWLTGSTRVSDTLVDLVDDRLLAHHRIDRATDPAAAQHVLTPTLRRLVSGPRRQTATPRELQRILTDIEAL